MEWCKEIQNRLGQLTKANYLFIFRCLFGLLMFINILKYIRIGLVENMFVKPYFNFTYPGLSFIKPLPPLLMDMLLIALAVCALFILMGILFKSSCRIFAVGLLYILLLDKSLYNNHIYLFVLLAVLLSFTSADKGLSLRNWNSPSGLVPNWHFFILKFQISLVYFFGGIVKLKGDWLFLHEPLRSEVANFATINQDYHFLTDNFFIIIMTYGSLIIDLIFPFLLWIRRTRIFAIAGLASFNLLNSYIFDDIGVFPFVMISALLIFLSPPGNNVGGYKPKPVNNEIKITKLAYTGIIFFLFQIIMPLRGFLLPNDQDYTTIANRFSWRMKADNRRIEEVEFTLTNSDDLLNRIPVEINTFINTTQMQHLVTDPRSIHQFALFLKSEAIKHGAIDPVVQAVIRFSYNGRPAKDFIDPKTDLTSVTVSPFVKIDWIIPIE